MWKYQVIKAVKWESTRKFATKLDTQWVFRGQSVEEWPETRLHREAQKRGHHLGIGEMPVYERWMLWEFQRGAAYYVNSLPAEHEYLDWFALMQHYGGPTRLLDFTRSFYVAAFFAMNQWTQKEGKKAAVWAINTQALHKGTPEEFAKRDWPPDRRKRVESVNEFIAKNIDGQPNEPFVLAVEPDGLNERLRVQQGLFMFPCEVDKTFYGNLAGALELQEWPPLDPEPVDWSDEILKDCHRSNNGTAILKILLPEADATNGCTDAKEILRDLRMMNITPATLFPGLVGFAESMSYHLRRGNER